MEQKPYYKDLPRILDSVTADWMEVMRAECHL